MRAAILIAIAGCANAGPSDPAHVPCNGVDVLLVIDDSSAMAAEQADIVANIPAFVTRLDLAHVAYRIGVTTTGRDFAYDTTTPFGMTHVMQTGDDGALVAPTACGAARPWVEPGDPQPAITLACLANVGTAG